MTHIIGDESPIEALVPPGFSTGYRGMFRGANTGDDVTVEFPNEMLVPRDEWKDRALEMAERKSRIVDLCDAAGLGVKDQGQTNFCWANAPCHALEITRIIQNQPMVKLSPASVACQINGFRNQGGWGEDALRFLVEHGAVPESQWPANAISKKYLTEANKTAAMQYRVTEWWRLEPRNLEQLISCLLLRMTPAVGYTWWGHEVTAVGVTWSGTDFDIDIDNSWGSGWGTNGRGALKGKKRLPDDAVVPRVAVAS